MKDCCPNSEWNGDQHGADCHDERAGEERQDAKVVFDGIPACGKQITEFDLGQRGNPSRRRKKKIRMTKTMAE